MTQQSCAEDWYALAQVDGLGPKRLHSLYQALNQGGRSIGHIFDFDIEDFQQLLPASMARFYPLIRAIDREQVQNDYLALLDEGIQIIHLGHPQYPKGLITHLATSAPPLLYCRGALALLNSRGVAIIGSRHASPEGVTFAKDIAGRLATSGYNIISGYATGIDTAGHLGALKARGTTTIVLSMGIQSFVPKHEFIPHLNDQDMLVLSQFSPRTRWSARNAMARNTIICALAQSAIVIESGAERDEYGRMSGTFDAGKTALQLEIPLFALAPGAFDNYPIGNAELLRRGAIPLKPSDPVDQVVSADVPRKEKSGQAQLPLL